jgi:two-component SAPR family response regulator
MGRIVTSFDISLLGPLCSAGWQGDPALRVGQGRALLAYLAAEVDRPQSRGSLAGLLWPDWPDEAAHKNLRHTIYSLRKSLGDDNAASPLIQSDRQFILFKSCNNCTIDTLELERALAAAQALQIGDGKQQSLIDRLRSIVEPNRGPFLEGFAWMTALLSRNGFKPSHHNKQILQGLGLLTDWHKQAGSIPRLRVARRQLALEPWHRPPAVDARVVVSIGAVLLWLSSKPAVLHSEMS